MKKVLLGLTLLLAAILLLGCEHLIDIHITNINEVMTDVPTANVTQETKSKHPEVIEVIASASIDVNPADGQLTTQAWGGSKNENVNVNIKEKLTFQIQGAIGFDDSAGLNGVVTANSNLTLTVFYNDVNAYTNLAVRMYTTNTTETDVGLVGDVYGDTVPLYVQTENLSTSNYFLIPNQETGAGLYTYLELYSWGDDPEAQQPIPGAVVNLDMIPVNFMANFTEARVQNYTTTIIIELVGILQ